MILTATLNDERAGCDKNLKKMRKKIACFSNFKMNLKTKRVRFLYFIG